MSKTPIKFNSVGRVVTDGEYAVNAIGGNSDEPDKIMVYLQHKRDKLQIQIDERYSDNIHGQHVIIKNGYLFL
jgi:hypothetical protein